MKELDKIEKSLQRITAKTDTLGSIQKSMLSVIQKASAPIGTVRDWKDGKYKKVGNGQWEKVTDQNKTTDKETQRNSGNENKEDGSNHSKEPDTSNQSNKKTYIGSSGNEYVKHEESSPYTPPPVKTISAEEAKKILSESMKRRFKLGAIFRGNGTGGMAPLDDDFINKVNDNMQFNIITPKGGPTSMFSKNMRVLQMFDKKTHEIFYKPLAVFEDGKWNELR